MTAPIREKERSAILAALGAGVVPALGLAHVQVGRRAEVEAMLGDLQRIESGSASCRFVMGPYGAGKSFFLNLVRSVAMERRFVVLRADITLDRRLSGSGGAARALVTELLRSTATRARPEGGALGAIVERWVGEVAGAGASDDASVAARIADALRPLQEFVGGYDFVTVVTAYHRAHAAHDSPAQEAAIRWLRAEYSARTDAKRDLGVRTIVDDENWYDHLKLLSAFFRLAGYQGLLVCIDELVVLSHRLNHKGARERNYEAILRILNDALQGSAEGIGFLFAGTDECVIDRRRGLCSYEALATRLSPNRFMRDGLVDFSGPVVRLSALSPEDCFVLLHNVRRVFMRGENEERLLPEAGIVAYLESCRRRMGSAYFQTPRETVRDFIGLLNVLEQNPSADWRSLIDQVRTTASSAAAEEAHAEPDVDDDLTAFRL